MWRLSRFLVLFLVLGVTLLGYGIDWHEQLRTT